VESKRPDLLPGRTGRRVTNVARRWHERAAAGRLPRGRGACRAGPAARASGGGRARPDRRSSRGRALV